MSTSSASEISNMDVEEQEATIQTVHESSASSEEEWGDSSQWEVGAIHEEHTRTRGEIQYKVSWKNWTRQDGSNCTWEREDGVTMQDVPHMLKNWKERQRSVLYEKARTNPTIAPFHAYDAPESDEDQPKEPNAKKKRKDRKRYIFTELTEQACEMAVDLKYQQPNPHSESLIFAEARFREMRAARERKLEELGVNLPDAVSLRHCGLGPVDEAYFQGRSEQKLVPQAITSDRQTPRPSLPPTLSRLQKRLEHSLSPSPSSVPKQVAKTTQALSRAKQPSSARKALETLWSKRARQEGAAPIYIVNDVNDDEIPALDPEKFIYLESQYIYNISEEPPDDGFMQSCECTTCNASSCSCQEDFESLDDEEEKKFAYSNGLFFNFDTLSNYVIECNKNCRCDNNCPSRVAQRPRGFPIQIFRTEKCGWGVRSTVDLPRGTVLGVYTGELRNREATSEFEGARAGYTFNLDFHGEVNDPSSGYAVDAFHCGNWTRFINHSCDPVCKTYPVIWDTVPMMHQPRQAFVAYTDIPAGTELTVDYCPQARKGKGRSRKKAPGTPDCMCGAKDCRGFIYLE